MQKFNQLQKTAGKCFLERQPDNSAYTIWIKNLVDITLCYTVSKIKFYEEIQGGGQIWWENNFWQKVADDSAYTLGAKNFIEIALSGTVSELNEFLHFTQKFKMVAEYARRAIFDKKVVDDYIYPGGQKFCRNHSTSHCFRDKCAFKFYVEF